MAVPIPMPPGTATVRRIGVGGPMRGVGVGHRVGLVVGYRGGGGGGGEGAQEAAAVVGSVCVGGW